MKKEFKNMLPMTESDLADFKKKPIPMKKETLEEKHIGHTINEFDKTYIEGFNNGAKCQQEQMYIDMQKYAIYAVECHITGLPFLKAMSWIETNKNK